MYLLVFGRCNFWFQQRQAHGCYSYSFYHHGHVNECVSPSMECRTDCLGYLERATCIAAQPEVCVVLMSHFIQASKVLVRSAVLE